MCSPMFPLLASTPCCRDLTHLSPACLNPQLTTFPLPPAWHALWKKHLPNTLSATSPVLLYCFLSFFFSFQAMFILLNGDFLVPPTLCSLSFTSLQVFQLWSHNVDTLLEERVCSPAPTRNSCLSSSFLDEHVVLASFCCLLSHLLLCSALSLAFPLSAHTFLLHVCS